MNISQALEGAQQQLSNAGIATARLDSLVLLEHTLIKDRSWLLANPDSQLTTVNVAKYHKFINARAKRIPLSQIIGKQEFWGLEFRINQDVLAPRPESEKIVELALQYRGPKASVLDVGTGCGALAVAIAKERPHWVITASEVSDKALLVARGNAKKHKVKLQIIKSDLLLGRALENKKFDVVVANLPYLKKGAEITIEATKEPAIALFGGKDGLDLYRLFFAQLPPHIGKKSLVIIESDPWQQPALIELASTIGLQPKSRDRFVLSLGY